MKIDYGWKNPQEFRAWGPYLSYGISAGTEMVVSWQSKFHTMQHWIEYGETPECKTRLEEKTFPISMHTWKLTQLKPNTLYYYRISRPEDLQQDPKPTYTFRTGPADGERVVVEFGITADVHAEGHNAVELFSTFRRNAPNASFLVTVGDCVTHGGEEDKWNDFFFQLKPFTSQFVLMNTTGNHDTDHDVSYAHFIQTFHHPYINPDLGGYYYFIYGNVLFIMLDSTNAGQSTATQGVISDQQMEWLEQVLKKFGKKDYWIFIFFHHPFYSMGDEGTLEIYELAYRDLFNEAQVDGVFYGHDHEFEVYWTERESAWGGTHYCLVGNGGGDLGLKNMDPQLKPHLPNNLWKGRTYIPERDGILEGYKGGKRNDKVVKESAVYGIIEHGFTHMRIEGDECEMKMWGLHNQLYFHDQFKRTGHGKKYHPPLHRQEF